MGMPDGGNVNGTVIAAERAHVNSNNDFEMIFARWSSARQRQRCGGGNSTQWRGIATGYCGIVDIAACDGTNSTFKLNEMNGVVRKKGQMIISLFTSEWLSANLPPPPPPSLPLACVCARGKLVQKHSKHGCRNTVSVALLQLLRRRVSPVTSIKINIYSQFRLTICLAFAFQLSHQMTTKTTTAESSECSLCCHGFQRTMRGQCTDFPRFRTKVSEMETKERHPHPRPPTTPAKWLCRNEQRTETIPFTLHLSTYHVQRTPTLKWDSGNNGEKSE